MQDIARTQTFLVVDASVLPEVFTRVVEAKKLLAAGQNISSAAKQVGISRSALYKYKDCVFAHSDAEDQIVATLNFSLLDKPGVLSQLINEISGLGANILTVNQNIPVDGVAPVSISIRVSRNTRLDQIINLADTIDGVVEAKLLTTQYN